MVAQNSWFKSNSPMHSKIFLEKNHTSPTHKPKQMTENLPNNDTFCWGLHIYKSLSRLRRLKELAFCEIFIPLNIFADLVHFRWSSAGLQNLFCKRTWGILHYWTTLCGFLRYYAISITFCLIKPQGCLFCAMVSMVTELQVQVLGGLPYL